jgi:hypothetical protein
MQFAFSQELWNRQSLAAVDVGIVFSKPSGSVFELARRYFSRGRIEIGSVTVFESRNDYDRVAPVKFHSTYDEWLRQLDSSHVTDPSFPCPTVSQVIKIGSETQVRSITRGCHGAHEVIGRDARTSAAGLMEGYDVLGISVIEAPRQSHQAPVTHTTVFLRSTGPPSVSAGEGILKNLQALVGGESLSVHIRPDTWFVEPTFFSFYPFDGRAASIPSKRGLESSPEVVCVALSDGSPSCSKFPENK